MSWLICLAPTILIWTTIAHQRPSYSFCRDTFIIEADIIKIKSYGLNHVKIPFGFWSVKKEASEPYAVGSYEYIKKAVEWCKKHGLKVMLDLHGVPGGQNGFDRYVASRVVSLVGLLFEQVLTLQSFRLRTVTINTALANATLWNGTQMMEMSVEHVKS